MSNKMRFYYTQGADHVSIELPNIHENDRGPMTLEVSESVEATVDMEVTYHDGETVEYTDGFFSYTQTEPGTAEYEITVKLRGNKVAYWWGEDPR